jgi:threonine dehydratase
MKFPIHELLGRIEAAHMHLVGCLPHTPLVFSPLLSSVAGSKVYLKCEHLQPTGSFKVRGVLNKMQHLSPEARRSGVITVSSGNHGQAMAWAGRRAQVPVTVYASAGASPAKLNAIRAWGATVVALDLPLQSVELEARRVAGLRGMAFVSPYNDADVIAGQGTMGLEMLQVCEAEGLRLDAVYASVGGGGMIGGVGTVMACRSRHTRVVGCWPAHSVALYHAMRAGKVVDSPEQETISDGTAGGIEPGAITVGLAQRVVRDAIFVAEADIREAMKLIVQSEHWMVEGAAGVAVAAMLQDTMRRASDTVAVVLCGRNIQWSTFVGAVA